jgi:hypothetical protein
LGETASPRKPDESVRAYVDRLEGTAGDDRIYEVLDAYERARYSDTGVSAAEAKAIARLVDEIVDRSVLRPSR